MSRSYSSVAASVRRSKEKRPRDYCHDPSCLYRATPEKPCPKHGTPVVKDIVTTIEAKAYRRYLCMSCHVNAPSLNSTVCSECDKERGVSA